MKIKDAHPVWAEMMLQTKSYMYTCAHVSGNMLKFIRQTRGAECEHSEEFGEVDKRHKLILSTWSDNVNLKSFEIAMPAPMPSVITKYFWGCILILMMG